MTIKFHFLAGFFPARCIQRYVQTVSGTKREANYNSDSRLRVKIHNEETTENTRASGPIKTRKRSGGDGRNTQTERCRLPLNLSRSIFLSRWYLAIVDRNLIRFKRTPRPLNRRPISACKNIDLVAEREVRFLREYFSSLVLYFLCIQVCICIFTRTIPRVRDQGVS